METDCMAKGAEKIKPGRVIWILFAAIWIAGAKTPPEVFSETVNVGTCGTTWEISEKDPVEEIKSAFAEKRDEIEARIETLRDLRNFQPANSVVIEPAKEKRSYEVDMTFTLDHDLTDIDGKLIYPAGTRYNILDYPPFPMKSKYVFFDGANPDQIEFVLERFSGERNVIFITGGGMAAWREAGKRIGSGLKMLTADLARVLHITQAVSVAYQSGRAIRVDVFPPPNDARDVVSPPDR
jgi:conjugal transfer pilus assembly protein TraW